MKIKGLNTTLIVHSNQKDIRGKSEIPKFWVTHENSDQVLFEATGSEGAELAIQFAINYILKN